MNLNIVIPVLNEENDLKPGVETTLNFLKTTSWRDHFEITIADNGSTDKTGEIAKDLCDSYENVNYFKVSQKGVGLAFREAIKRNECEIIGYMDVDLATDIKHFRQVYDLFTDPFVDIAVGSRLLHDSRVYGRSLIREITSRMLNLILKMVLKVHFTDAMCGFKFYRKKLRII